jgi:hypothetical protein
MPWNHEVGRRWPLRKYVSMFGFTGGHKRIGLVEKHITSVRTDGDV